jgi:glycine cleavage system H protein
MAYKVIEGLYYTKSDEWVKVEDDIATVGITDYAQDKLGDIVYLEQAKPGTKVKVDERVITIESVKAASDINAPVSGAIIEVNDKVVSDPSIINKDPYGAGWLFKIKMENMEEMKDLIDANSYQDYRKE